MNTNIFQFLVLMVSGWITRRQQFAIDYLKEENRILMGKFKGKRIRFTDKERRRLAAKAKILGRKKLKEIEYIVTPDTLLRWYRNLIAQKYDGSKKRGPGRPRTQQKIRDLVVRMALDNPTYVKQPVMLNVADRNCIAGSLGLLCAYSGLNRSPIPDGTNTLKGKDFVVEGSGKGEITATGDLTLKGGKIDLNP